LKGRSGDNKLHSFGGWKENDREKEGEREGEWERGTRNRNENESRTQGEGKQALHVAAAAMKILYGGILKSRVLGTTERPCSS